jgi:hypothetical protein
VKGGFFLRKKPLSVVLSVCTIPKDEYQGSPGGRGLPAKAVVVALRHPAGAKALVDFGTLYGTTEAVP